MAFTNGFSVLVIEDHNFQRKTIARILHTLGANTIMEATDGKQGLEVIQNSNPIDLIICDLDMPHMDGMEFMRHLAKSNSNIPMIISSAKDSSLLDSVAQMAKAYGIKLMGIIKKPDVAPVLENLTRLRMRGFGLSIDDYGTGFSSMQQLTRIPFTELKIDQSFVTGCKINSASWAVIESSIAMAHRLGIKSIAEGVETQEEYNMLNTMGCDMAQGYLISKPLEEKYFLKLCENYRLKS